MKKLLAALLTMMFASTAFAQDEPDSVGNIVEPEPLPPKVDGPDDTLETSVRVIPGADGDSIEEYRVNGQLVMVKVVPKDLPPYYVMDTDGDGRLDRSNDVIGPIQPVYYELFEWD